MSRATLLALSLAALAGGCRTTPAMTDSTAATTEPGDAGGLFGPTWTLVRLDGALPPAGAGGRQATVVFARADGGGARGSGDAGCNRWSSEATVTSPDGLRFTAPVSTRMACAEGMELERRFLALVTGVRSFRLTGDTLVLRAEGGGEGAFVRR